MSGWVKSLGFAVVGAVLLGTPAYAADKPSVTGFKITNMSKDTKAADVKKLESELKKVKGVVSVAVMKKKGEVKVKHGAEATADAIKEVIAKAGFTIEEPKPAGDAAAAGDKPVEGGAEVPAEKPAEVPAAKPADAPTP